MSGTIIGTHLDGATIAKSISFTHTSDTFTTISFAGFESLSSVSFQVGANQIDNVVLTPSPAPASDSTPLPTAAMGGMTLLSGLCLNRGRRATCG